MDVYKVLEGKPKFEKYTGVDHIISKLTLSGSGIYNTTDKIFKHYFGPDRELGADKFISILHKDIGKGIILFHRLFIKSNIKASNLEDYFDHIIREQGLADSEHYTGGDYMDKMVKLINYSMVIIEGQQNKGYPCKSTNYKPIRISNEVRSNCHHPLLQMFMYLNTAKIIFSDSHTTNKTEAQGFLVEAFMMWVKVALILGIDIETSIKEVI